MSRATGPAVAVTRLKRKISLEIGLDPDTGDWREPTDDDRATYKAWLAKFYRLHRDYGTRMERIHERRLRRRGGRTALRAEGVTYHRPKRRSAWNLGRRLAVAGASWHAVPDAAVDGYIAGLARMARRNASA